jgi:hypothetical protein
MECVAASFPIKITANYNYIRAQCSISHALVECPRLPNSSCNNLYVARTSLPLTTSSNGEIYTGTNRIID